MSFVGDLWRRGWIRAVVIVGTALALAVVTALERTSRPPPDEGVERPSLHRWSLLGCYALRLGSWTASSGTGAAGDAGDSIPERIRAPEGGLTPAAGELLAAAAPPAEVMLLPDSVDRWGRVLPSYRATTLPGTAEREGPLRWFVRSDTLWFLWSAGDVRAGMALHETRDGLRGRARAQGGADSLDASATATAWPVNCETLAPVSAPEWERR